MGKIGYFIESKLVNKTWKLIGLSFLLSGGATILIHSIPLESNAREKIYSPKVEERDLNGNGVNEKFYVINGDTAYALIDGKSPLESVR